MEVNEIFFLMAIGIVSFVLSFYGSAIGLILGHLRLPMLVYCLPSTAVGMSTNLAISGLGALTGAIKHGRDGRISLPLFLLMGIPSIAGAAIGAMTLMRIDSGWARVGIGICLVISGLSVFFTRSTEDTQTASVLGVWRIFAEVGIGLFVGFLAAVTGLMLGSLRLPMMMRVLKIDSRIAIGTNMAIGCLTALTGAFILWPKAESFALWPLLIIAPPTILGGYLGARYTGKFRKETLQRLVGVTILLTGMGMAVEGVWRNVGSQFATAPAMASEHKMAPSGHSQGHDLRISDGTPQEADHPDSSSIPTDFSMKIPNARVLVRKLPRVMPRILAACS